MSLPTGIVTHVQRVKRLYKRALRNLESWYDRREVYRYQAVLMRQRFDKNRCIDNMAHAKDLVLDGERELFEKQHWHVRQFYGSPGGSCYEREVPPPDWVLDYWHPLEKAQYPEYFATREKRKKEYIKFWEKQFGLGECENDKDKKDECLEEDNKDNKSCEDEEKK